MHGSWGRVGGPLQVHGMTPFDEVVGQFAAIFQRLSAKDYPLLIGTDAPLVADPRFHVVDVA